MKNHFVYLDDEGKTTITNTKTRRRTQTTKTFLSAQGYWCKCSTPSHLGVKFLTQPSPSDVATRVKFGRLILVRGAIYFY